MDDSTKIPLKKKGRRAKIIDVELLKNLALIHCTYDEMAHLLKCSRDVLIKKYSSLVDEYKSKGKMSLRRKMWHLALEENNVNLIKWLSANELGYSDKVQANQEIEVKADVREVIVYETSWGSTIEASDGNAQIKDGE